MRTRLPGGPILEITRAAGPGRLLWTITTPGDESKSTGDWTERTGEWRSWRYDAGPEPQAWGAETKGTLRECLAKAKLTAEDENAAEKTLREPGPLLTTLSVMES